MRTITHAKLRLCTQYSEAGKLTALPYARSAAARCVDEQQRSEVRVDDMTW